jgi:hypothetical protein
VHENKLAIWSRNGYGGLDFGSLSDNARKIAGKIGIGLTSGFYERKSEENLLNRINKAEKRDFRQFSELTNKAKSEKEKSQKFLLAKEKI